MGEASEKTISRSFATYAEYIEAEYTDNYRPYGWLVDYLRSVHPPAPEDVSALPAWIYIFEGDDDILKSRKFDVRRNGPIDPLLVEALRAESAYQTRLIWVQYDKFENVNPMCMDMIGLFCQLHPGLFATHFETGFDQTGQFSAHYPTHSLPSERQFLQIRTDDSKYMTATWEMSEAQKTFVVLEMDQYIGMGDQTSMLHEKLINHTPPEEIARMNQNPADYFFPYIREAARRGASLCAQLTPFRVQEECSDVRHLATKWDINQKNRRALAASCNSLSRFLARPEISHGPSPLRLSKLLSDYEELIQESEMIAADILVRLQEQTNVASMEQTRRPSEPTPSAPNDAIQRLSIVGFVFIPLTFATSFLGMNVREFQTDRLSLAFFFLVVILSGALCVLLANTFNSIDRKFFKRK